MNILISTYNKKLVTLLGLATSILLLSTSPQANEELRDHTQYDKNDWRAYSQYDRQFTVDVLKLLSSARASQVTDTPWRYTSAFAQRFAMPKRWVNDADLGAMAIAFRMEIDTGLRCDNNGHLDHCVRNTPLCYYDLYLPTHDAAIPWNTSQPYVVAHGGNTSQYFLQPQLFKDGKARQALLPLDQLTQYQNQLTQQSYNDLVAYKGIDRDRAGVGIDHVVGIYTQASGQTQTVPLVSARLFRNVLQGIDFISVGGQCEGINTIEGAGQLRLSDNASANTDYIINLDASFMAKVKHYYQTNMTTLTRQMAKRQAKLTSQQ